ncbi:hypothetical protein AAC387_Pa02g2590 [Persea americana]
MTLKSSSGATEKLMCPFHAKLHIFGHTEDGFGYRVYHLHTTRVSFPFKTQSFGLNFYYKLWVAPVSTNAYVGLSLDRIFVNINSL